MTSHSNNLTSEEIAKANPCIEARLKKYLISTRREETLAKMAVVREHASEIDVAWLTKRIDEAEKRVKHLKGRLEEITEPDISRVTTTRAIGTTSY